MPSRSLTTEVWYPTAPHAGVPLRDAPAARGRFPLVMNSHGYSDIRTGEGYLAEALASRGYVVASPDFPLTNLTTQTRDPVDVVSGAERSRQWHRRGRVRHALHRAAAVQRADAGRAAACCFLRQGLAAGNGDVQVDIHRAGR